jgi:hypothetical protein
VQEKLKNEKLVLKVMHQGKIANNLKYAPDEQIKRLTNMIRESNDAKKYEFESPTRHVSTYLLPN